MNKPAVPTTENPLPCPVPAPDTGLPCVKKIPPGWTADEGHAGGHMWMSDRTSRILDGGHYDATAALSGLPFDGHLPEECDGDCRFMMFLALGRRA
jgi:hypothetical protein